MISKKRKGEVMGIFFSPIRFLSAICLTIFIYLFHFISFFLDLRIHNFWHFSKKKQTQKTTKKKTLHKIFVIMLVICIFINSLNVEDKI